MLSREITSIGNAIGLRLQRVVMGKENRYMLLVFEDGVLCQFTTVTNCYSEAIEIAGENTIFSCDYNGEALVQCGVFTREEYDKDLDEARQLRLAAEQSRLNAVREEYERLKKLFEGDQAQGGSV